MYCKICGNLLSDSDLICKVCGAAVSSEPAETPKQESGEEVIFNPPYTSFAKNREPAETQESIEKQEVKKERKIGKPDTGEFAWNVYDFPKATKTEEPQFNWSSEEVKATNIAQAEARAEAESKAMRQAEKRAEAESKAMWQAEKKPEAKAMAEMETRTKEDLTEARAQLEARIKEEEAKAKLEARAKAEAALNRETIEYKKDILTQTVDKEKVEAVLPKSIEIPESEDYILPKNVEIAREESFASPEVTEDISDAITQKEIEKATLQEFQDMGIDTGNAGKDRFFTFSKKNEEFQRLLDKEYARINGLEEPVKETAKAKKEELLNEKFDKSDVVVANKLNFENKPQEAVGTPIISNVPLNTTLDSQAHEPKAQEPGIHEPKAQEPEIHAPKTQEPEIQEPTLKEPILRQTVVMPDKTQIDEMAEARKNFFTETMDEEIVLDNDAIKQKYDTLEVMRKTLKSSTDDVDKIERSGNAGNGGNISESNSVGKEFAPQIKTENLSCNKEPKEEEFEKDEYYDEEKSTSGLASKIVLAVIVLLLVAELIILGIKYFMPDSQATAFILDKEIIIVENITHLIDSIKGIFSK